MSTFLNYNCTEGVRKGTSLIFTLHSTIKSGDDSTFIVKSKEFQKFKIDKKESKKQLHSRNVSTFSDQFQNTHIANPLLKSLMKITMSKSSIKGKVRVIKTKK